MFSLNLVLYDSPPQPVVLRMFHEYEKNIPSLIPPIWNVPTILLTLFKFNSHFKVNLNLILQMKFFLPPQFTVIFLF